MLKGDKELLFNRKGKCLYDEAGMGHPAFPTPLICSIAGDREEAEGSECLYRDRSHIPCADWLTARSHRSLSITYL